MPASVLRTTLVLCVLAGLLGVWLGLLHAGTSEGDLVEMAAELWIEETGSSDTSSCFGWTSGKNGIWLEVSCGAGDMKRVYMFDFDGRLIPSRDPDA